MTIYSKDANAQYTHVVYTFLTATGTTAPRTPTGTFPLEKTRDRWHRFSLLSGGHTYCQYATPIDVGGNGTGRIFIHSAEYTSENIARLDQSFYDKIGTNDTAGCLRVCAFAAWWVYTYCPAGTMVEIVNGSPKGTSAVRPPDPVKGPGKYDLYDQTDPGYPGFVEPPPQ